MFLISKQILANTLIKMHYPILIQKLTRGSFSLYIIPACQRSLVPCFQALACMLYSFCRLSWSRNRDLNPVHPFLIVNYQLKTCFLIFNNIDISKSGENLIQVTLQKGGVPATPSGTATLLRLSPSYRFYPRQSLAVIDFRYPQLPWLDGRCVQGPGTYSPYHG
jgi:hypothetical protein